MIKGASAEERTRFSLGQECQEYRYIRGEVDAPGSTTPPLSDGVWRVACGAWGVQC